MKGPRSQAARAISSTQLDPEILELIEFHKRIGLSTRLADLGMADPTGEEITEIARWTMTAPHLKNLAREIDTGAIAEAIARVEHLAPWAPNPGDRDIPGSEIECLKTLSA